MEFKEFVKERQRMCNCSKMCDECPLFIVYGTGTQGPCAKRCMDEAEQAEEIVSKWSKENPIVTNLDKYKQLMKDHFGIMVTANETGAHLVGGSEIASSEWWNKEYKEPGK